MTIENFKTKILITTSISATEESRRFVNLLRNIISNANSVNRGNSSLDSLKFRMVENKIEYLYIVTSKDGKIDKLKIYHLQNNDLIKPEVFFNKETRFDFLLERETQKTFVEVKNVTLFRNKDTAEFPDAPTSRGIKHLLTLIDAIKKSYKTYLIFLVQIQNMKYFKIAKDIDEEYYKNYLIAKKAGVNFLAYRCDISSKRIFIDKKLKIIDD